MRLSYWPRHWSYAVGCSVTSTPTHDKPRRDSELSWNRRFPARWVPPPSRRVLILFQMLPGNKGRIVTIKNGQSRWPGWGLLTAWQGRRVTTANAGLHDLP